MILNLRGETSVANEIMNLLDFNEQSGGVWTSNTGWAIVKDPNYVRSVSQNYSVYIEGNFHLGDVTYAFLDTDVSKAEPFVAAGRDVYEIDSKKPLQEVLDLMGVVQNTRQLVMEGGTKHILLPGAPREPYRAIKGWGKVKPVLDLKAIAPLCRYPYYNHKTGCHFCHRKVFYTDIVDDTKEIYALYFSMNLEPLWDKLRKRHPNWTEPQVKNVRYWTGTKKKLRKQLAQEFLAENPGPWCRFLTRAPGHVNYTFGIYYNKTMEQIGINLKWPPEPYPIVVSLLGRPRADVNHEPRFILE